MINNLFFFVIVYPLKDHFMTIFIFFVLPILIVILLFTFFYKRNRDMKRPEIIKNQEIKKRSLIKTIVDIDRYIISSNIDIEKKIIEYLEIKKWNKIDKYLYKKGYININIFRDDKENNKYIFDIWYKDIFGVITRSNDVFYSIGISNIVRTTIKKWLEQIKEFDSNIKIEHTYTLKESTSKIFFTIVSFIVLTLSILIPSFIILYYYK